MPNDPKTLTWYSKTNKRENSCTKATCGCSLWFELHQQTAIKLLSNHTKNNEYKLEPGYEARAKRIAAIYAHLFLETLVLNDEAYPNQSIKFGNTNLVGRFYWMGLGAFASKTMARIFHQKRSHWGHQMNLQDSREPINIPAKGNLWLAMDIIPWHLAWAQDRVSFEQCISSRDLSKFNNLKPAIDSLPWASSTPRKINNLKATKEIRDAFLTQLKLIEKEFNDPKNNTEQLKFQNAASYLEKHLKQIAIQEQKKYSTKNLLG